MTDPQPSCSEIAKDLITKHFGQASSTNYVQFEADITEALEAKQATITSLRAEVAVLKSANVLSHANDYLRNENSRLKEILKGRDEALRNIASDKMYDCECNRQHWAKQALSKTWEEGE